MEHNNVFYHSVIALLSALAICGCFSQPNVTIPDNDIGYDSGTLRNVQRISDDGFGKTWVVASNDGVSLLYNEMTMENIHNKKETTVNATITNRVIYLRNAQVFAKTPTSVEVENSDKLIIGNDVVFAPEIDVISIPKGMSAQDAANIHLARFIKADASAPGVAAFYENGTNFIYSDAERGSRQLAKANVNNTSKTFITQNPVGQGDSYPSLRDGIIAFQTTINNQSRIIILREDGNSIKRNRQQSDGSIVTEDARQLNLGPGEQPSWHPTEDKVVFILDGNIMEMDIYATQQTQIYGISNREKQEGVSCGLPSFTADGKYILFLKRAKVTSYKQGKTEIPIHRTHLYRMNTDGSNITELTSGNLDITYYSASKDDKVFFISNAGNKTEIWSATITLGE